MLLLMVLAPATAAHACGGDGDATSTCPCAPSDASDPPLLRRQPCCEAEPAAASAPVMGSGDGAAEAVALTELPVMSRLLPATVGAPARATVWPRGPPGSVPIYLSCCSLLR